MPKNKIPIIIAGGSFNSQDKETKTTKYGEKIIRDLIKKVNSKKSYIVIGHQVQGYEKQNFPINHYFPCFMVGDFFIGSAKNPRRGGDFAYQ